MKRGLLYSCIRRIRTTTQKNPSQTIYIQLKRKLCKTKDEKKATRNGNKSIRSMQIFFVRVFIKVTADKDSRTENRFSFVESTSLLFFYISHLFACNRLNWRRTFTFLKVCSPLHISAAYKRDGLLRFGIG